MSNSLTAEYLATISDVKIRFTPYAVMKTGLISGQTILKIEDYMLICSPYQLSMKKAILLLILSPEETHFFQRFKNEASSLNLTFQKPGRNTTLMFDVKGIIVQIGPVKGKKNMCMIEFDFTAASPELNEILGNYIQTYNSLKGYYDSFRDKTITINQESASMLRFNNYMECFLNSQKVRATLISISSDMLAFSIPSTIPDIIEGTTFSSKLFCNYSAKKIKKSH